ncbi:MAG: hypothetical protein ACLU80_10110 [Dorea sp.]
MQISSTSTIIRDDQALFLDKKFVERKLEVMQTTYEHYKELARVFAGPACMEMFGEEPFAPVQKQECSYADMRSRKNYRCQFDSRSESDW